MEGLAIIDDQASISIVDPIIIDNLQIKESDMEDTTLSTTTIQGTSYPEQCKLLHGLTVSSIDGYNPITLPSVYLHKKLPNAIDEVPTKETISSIPGLQHLTDQFAKKKRWPTIVLIGRDCTVAQFQEDMTFNDDKRQIASKTPLGWVLIGQQIELDNNKYKKNAPPTYCHKLLNNLLPQMTDIAATKYIKEFNINTANEAIELQGLKEEELKGYSQDETIFLRKVANHGHQRSDGMIELPLPFIEDNPTFPYNRTVALQRTKMELEKLRKRRPKEFQSALDKFAKNINMKQPRFVPVPFNQRHNTNGYAYWIPLFSVWQKEKSRIVFDSAAQTQKYALTIH